MTCRIAKLPIPRNFIDATMDPDVIAIIAGRPTIWKNLDNNAMQAVLRFRNGQEIARPRRSQHDLTGAEPGEYRWLAALGFVLGTMLLALAGRVAIA